MLVTMHASWMEPGFVHMFFLSLYLSFADLFHVAFKVVCTMFYTVAFGW